MSVDDVRSGDGEDLASRRMSLQLAQAEVDAIRLSVEKLVSEVDAARAGHRQLVELIHAQEKVIQSTFDTLERIADERTGCDWIARKTAALGMKEASEIYVKETGPKVLGG